MGSHQISLQKFARLVEKRRKNKCDTLIFISGNTGSGKSTLAIKLALKIRNMSEKFKFKIDDKHIIYTRNEILNALVKKKEHILIADELIGIAYKREFYNSLQKDIIKTTNLFRSNRNVLIGCIPSFSDLDIGLMDRCTFHIWVPERGRAIIRAKKKSIISADPWYVKAITRMEAKDKTFNNLTRRIPGTIARIYFKPLMKKTEKKYEVIKEERRNRILQKELALSPLEDQVSTFYNNLYEKLTTWKMTRDKLKEYCDVVGKDPKVVRSELNRLLKMRENPNRTNYYLTVKNRPAKKPDVLK